MSDEIEIKRNTKEVILGIVLIILCVFVFSIPKHYKNHGYIIFAQFNNVGSDIRVNTEVKIAGIKIGYVNNIYYDSKIKKAILKLNIYNNILIPSDSIAEIISNSFISKNFIEILPGNSTNYIKKNGIITNTNDPIDLEQIIKKKFN